MNKVFADMTAARLDPAFAEAANSIVAVSHRIHQRGWVPATSGNFSQRLDRQSCAITSSGRDKGRLCVEEVIRVNLQGQALDGGQPSAETLLHTALYQRDMTIGAVLHTHSMFAVLVSAAAARMNKDVELSGLEILKAFSGRSTHEGSFRIPVFANTQDIAALAGQVNSTLDKLGTGHAYLIDGHGVYTWGRDMSEAMRHLEALEYLFEYTWRSQHNQSH